MKASRFTDTPIITILREAETGQLTIEALCRKHAISEATFYRWRSKYGGMNASDVTRLKERERENTRLKKLLAERDLEIEVMQEVNAKKGKRTRTPRASSLCRHARSITPTCVCAVPRCAVALPLLQSHAGARSRTAAAPAYNRPAVSTLWLSSCMGHTAAEPSDH